MKTVRSVQARPVCPPERYVHLTFFLLCLLPAAAATVLSTNGSICFLKIGNIRFPVRTLCLFKAMTGYNCPVCGMTRGFVYMAHGNFPAAWSRNPASVLLYPFCWYEALYRFTLLIWGKVPLGRFLKGFELLFIVITCALDVLFFIGQFFGFALGR